MDTLSFIKFYANKIGFKLNGNLSEHDIYNEAFILSYENNKDIKENIKTITWLELRKHIASKILYKDVPCDYQKRCKACGEYKNHIEFRKMFSKETNLKYFYYKCKPCEQEYKNKWLMNKYYNDPIYNEKMKENSRSYKMKVKQSKLQKHEL